MLKNYIITAFRNLWRNKFFSSINIFGLSIGIACCMLIVLYTKDEISFDGFHTNKENIYRITADITSATGSIDKQGSTGMMPGPGFKAQVPEILDFMRLQYAQFDIKKGTEIFEQTALFTDENFFSVFSFPLIYGNPKTALKDVRSIVISETIAEKYFGKTNVVGNILQLSTGKKFEPFVVSGVAKNSPQNSSIKLEILVPMKYHQQESDRQFDDKQWLNFFLNTFVVLKPGATIKNIEDKCNRVYTTEAALQIKEGAEKYGFKDKITYKLQPLLQMHLDTDYGADNGLSGGSNPVYSYILGGITAFILLIACINFVNLTVARSLKRAKEIGIRKVVGSQRKQLILQFLGESFILSFFAFVLALLITYVTLPFFNQLANKELSFSYLSDLKLVVGYLTLFIVTSLLAGFYPALVLSNFNPVETLYGKFRFHGKNHLSKGLIVFQFTLASFLIIATLTIYSQFNFLINYNLGYDTKNVIKITTPELNNEKLTLLKNELHKSPSIAMITANQGGEWGTLAYINGEQSLDFDFKHIDPDYFSLFKIPLVKGRNFSNAISSDSSKAVVVNESFVKAAGWKNPIGEIVDFFYKNKKYNVIGVTRDYHFASLTEKIKPQLFTISKDYKYETVYVKINPGSRSQAMRHLESTFKNLYPVSPYNPVLIDTSIEENYSSEAKWKQIISFSALITIFISCIGLFGLAALSSEKRAKEIGIRKVLGATINTLIKTLSLDFLKLVGIAACISVPAAWWAMSKWLEAYPYRIELKVYTFALSIAMVMALALLTVSYQAIKAALANPAKSLRTD